MSSAFLFFFSECYHIFIFMRTFVSEITQKEGQKVTLMGWVSVRRDHGKLIFIDLRDMTGVCQAVFIGKELHAQANQLRSEWVVQISGQVNKRPLAMVNKDIATGEYELAVESLEILNEATTPAFDLATDGYDVNEEVRMKYRYVDLRRPRLQKNIRNRDKIIALIRDFLHKYGFLEIETPILTKSTPEGARDYLVPSRVYPGTFYALPQSPQQYKQLLMTAGFERYFQIARCFRDEDTRGDRQPEFTQLDMEMSFMSEEEIMHVTEALLIEIAQRLYPHKRIQQIPFPKISYADAIAKYGSDRPDIREDKNDPNLLAFCWVVDFPFFEKIDGGGWTFTHNPFSGPRTEHLPWLMDKEKIEDIRAAQYDIVLNGLEIGGGSIRNHRPEALKKVFEIMGFAEERIQKNFGHMLEALASGAPPHGGIAWGFDRLLMILENEPNIREVMAFPKTGDGQDPLMSAPSEVDQKQLSELGLEIKKIKNKI